MTSLFSIVSKTFHHFSCSLDNSSLFKVYSSVAANVCLIRLSISSKSKYASCLYMQFYLCLNKAKLQALFIYLLYLFCFVFDCHLIIKLFSCLFWNTISCFYKLNGGRHCAWFFNNGHISFKSTSTNFSIFKLCLAF